MVISVKATDLTRAMGIDTYRVSSGKVTKLPPLSIDEVICKKRDELLKMDDKDFYHEVGSMSSDELESMLRFG